MCPSTSYPFYMVCYTVCPGSSDPLCIDIVSYFIKWVTTSWTHSSCANAQPSVPVAQVGGGEGLISMPEFELNYIWLESSV